MTVLHLNDVGFDGRTKPGLLRKYRVKIVSIQRVTTSFSFGKIYLLNSQPFGVAQTLSLIVGGLIKEDHGTITKDGDLFPIGDRLNQACCVRANLGKRFLFWEQTVRSQIREALRENLNPVLQSENEVVTKFHLSSGRLDRSLRHYSAEAWRASTAIGVAQGKTMFCFTYTPPEVLEEKYVKWIKEMLYFLRDLGALVLVPTMVRSSVQDIGDEVLELGYTEIEE